ncbi:hypothetical protein LUZ60_007538 [Juncus effusus]|nr:hypothetical protein LUZ60_007538 [Juncus effusus]
MKALHRLISLNTKHKWITQPLLHHYQLTSSSNSRLPPPELIRPTINLSDLSSSSPNKSPWLSRILNLILNSEPSCLEDKLSSYCETHLLFLSPCFTSQILRNHPLVSRPHTALQFFRWAVKHHGNYQNATEYQQSMVDSYVSLIHSFSSCEAVKDVKFQTQQLFDEMRSFGGLKLNETASASLIKSLGVVGLVEELLFVWREMKNNGLNLSVLHYNCLMDGLVNSGFVDSAEKVFETMQEQQEDTNIQPDIFSFNTMIKAYSKTQQTHKAVHLFNTMREKFGVFPDKITYLSLMQCHYSDDSFHECISLFHEMEERGLEIPSHAYSLVITGLSKEGKPFEAHKVFDKMLERNCNPNSAVYTALIDSFAKCGRFDQALSLFERMKTEGFKPDEITYGVVINCLCKAGKLNEAMEIFEFCQNERGVNVNVYFYASLIDGFGKLGSVDRAEKLFDDMLERGILPDSYCYNTLMDCLVKEGRTNDALNYFKKMENDGCAPTVYTYTILIDGLFKQHRNEEALKFWNKMIDKGITPTLASFRVLSIGLCLSGKFNRACKILDDLAPLGILPQNSYEEMLNVLCKAKRFKHACKLADEIVGKEREIPSRVRTVMINSLRKAGNAELAIKLMHSKIGIGYVRFGSIKRRVKFSTLFD